MSQHTLRNLRRSDRWLRLLGLALALSFAAAPAVGEDQTIGLAPGWNLISFAVAPDDSDPAAVLAPLLPGSGNGTFLILWTYDAATQNWTTYPVPPTDTATGITAIEGGRAYWIKVTSQTDLTVSGDLTGSTSTLDLVTGWNLVGFPSLSEKHYDRVFNGEILDQIWRFDATLGQFEGTYFTPAGDPVNGEEGFNLIQPGEGYWVHVASPLLIEPTVATSLPPDIDVSPPVAAGAPDMPVLFTLSPGDRDFGNDGYFDRPLTQRAMWFGDEVSLQRLSIFNAAGAGLLSYRVSVEDPTANPWVRFRVTDPDGATELITDTLSGTVSTETVDLDVLVDRSGLVPGSYQATITLETNDTSPGGSPIRTFDVYADVPSIVGDYEIIARIATINGKQADTHNPRISLSLYDDATGLKGIIDDDKTLLMPERFQMTGYRFEQGTTRFSVSGALALPVGHADNPYAADLRRDITLIGERSAFSDPSAPSLEISGEYRETIRNVLDEPIYLVGTFRAERVDPVPTSIGNSQAELGVATLINPGATVEVTLPISDRRLVTDVGVSMTLQHPNPANLSVKLESPQGTELVMSSSLAGRPAGQQFVLDFDLLDAPEEELSLFDSEYSNGDWKLIFEDAGTPAPGILVGADLTVHGTRLSTITGTVPGGSVPVGSTIVLTGCGRSEVALTGPGGTYRFEDLTDCGYLLTLAAPGFESTSVEVVVNGADEVQAFPAPASAPANPGQELPNPTDGTLRLAYLSVHGGAGATTDGPLGAGLLPPTLGGQAAVDSATYDIDRPGTTAAGVPGPEDSNPFTNQPHPIAMTNQTGVNTTLDSHVGGGTPYRMLVSIGHPVIGRGAGGDIIATVGSGL